MTLRPGVHVAHGSRAGVGGGLNGTRVCAPAFCARRCPWLARSMLLWVAAAFSWRVKVEAA
eukprot:11088231-Heterocapsa_arctica.AAC.1